MVYQAFSTYTVNSACDYSFPHTTNEGTCCMVFGFSVVSVQLFQRRSPMKIRRLIPHRSVMLSLLMCSLLTLLVACTVNLGTPPPGTPVGRTGRKQLIAWKRFWPVASNTANLYSSFALPHCQLRCGVLCYRCNHGNCDLESAEQQLHHYACCC